MKLLITFGCSWVYGVGVSYTDGISKTEFKKTAWNKKLCDSFSFRGILSREFGFENLNFSVGGSSNQEQFRKAEYFFTPENIEELHNIYDEILVLWGITSVYRNEIYHNDKDKSLSFFYHDKSDLSKVILSEHFNELYETFLLANKIRFWESYFKKNNIKSIWYDLFNHHDYEKSIYKYSNIEDYIENSGQEWPTLDNLLFGNLSTVSSSVKSELSNFSRWHYAACNYSNVKDNFVNWDKFPRDMCGCLAEQHGLKNIDKNYHISSWIKDSNKIEYLVKKNILNPISKHPTKDGHKQIADMLSKYFK